MFVLGVDNLSVFIFVSRSVHLTLFYIQCPRCFLFSLLFLHLLYTSLYRGLGWQPIFFGEIFGRGSICLYIPLSLTHSLTPFNPSLPLWHLYSCIPTLSQCQDRCLFWSLLWHPGLPELSSLLSASSNWDHPPLTKPHLAGVSVNAGQHIGSIIQMSLQRGMNVYIMSMYIISGTVLNL